MTLALLGRGDRAQSVDEVVVGLRNLLYYVRGRGLPTTGDLELDHADGVRRALDRLVENGVLTCFAGGFEPVYAIGADQHLTAAYYRNTIAHFFVNGAIAELALLRAAEDDVRDRVAELWAEALRLRDLLKFEFFFAEREKFRRELSDELAFHSPGWDEEVTAGPDGIQGVLKRIRPFMAHRVLLPFFEAYQVVGDALEREAVDGGAIDDAAFLSRCMALGEQYRLQHRIRSAESVSRLLFESALKLAKNRGLVDGDPSDLPARRAAFAAELRAAIRRAEAIDVLAASRRAGLID